MKNIKKVIIIFVILLLTVSVLLGVSYLAISRNMLVANNGLIDKLPITESEDLSVNPKEADFQIGAAADYNIEKVEDLYKEAELVIVGSYIKDNKCYITGPKAITTNAEFEVKEVLKGEYNSNKIDISYYGGTMLLGEYIECQTEDQLRKKGWDKLSKDELANKTISYSVDETGVNVLKNKEYVIFLKYSKEKGAYAVLSDGYGMREVSEDNKMYNLDTKTFDTKITELK